MTIQFPVLPSTSQTHAEAGVAWRWDGEKWLATTAANPLLPPVSLVVTDSEVLPVGFSGTVLVQQTAPATITLPASPTTGQAITVKDAAGQAGAYPITIAGLIEGVSGMTLSFNYGWVSLTWAGAQWVQA